MDTWVDAVLYALGCWASSFTEDRKHLDNLKAGWVVERRRRCRAFGTVTILPFVQESGRGQRLQSLCCRRSFEVIYLHIPAAAPVCVSCTHSNTHRLIPLWDPEPFGPSLFVSDVLGSCFSFPPFWFFFFFCSPWNSSSCWMEITLV